MNASIAIAALPARRGTPQGLPHLAPTNPCGTADYQSMHGLDRAAHRAELVRLANAVQRRAVAPGDSEHRVFVLGAVPPSASSLAVTQRLPRLQRLDSWD